MLTRLACSIFKVRLLRPEKSTPGLLGEERNGMGILQLLPLRAEIHPETTVNDPHPRPIELALLRTDFWVLPTGR